MPFLKDWIKSGVASPEGWKGAIKRCIPELENYTGDVVDLPVWLADGLVNPLLRDEKVSMGDLVWFNEEEKDELFDVSGQFKLAALILKDQLKSGKSKADVKSAFESSSKDAFEFMKGLLDDSGDKETVVEFVTENVE